MRRSVRLLGALLVVASCGGGDGGTAPPLETTPSFSPTTRSTVARTTTSSTSSTTAPPRPLKVLVTNDDGIADPGLDVLVRALGELPGVEVTVVTPARDHSGASDATTPGPVAQLPGQTLGGTPGLVVEGFPADAVRTAVDDLGLQPDLVVAGINAGPSVGPLVRLSGAVGAAREAARRGIPAMAVGTGVVPAPDYDTAARLVVDLVGQVRDVLRFGGNTTATVVNLNVPACASGSMRGIVDAAVARGFPADANAFALVSDCASQVTSVPKDDVDALLTGYAPRSQVPADLQG